MKKVNKVLVFVLIFALVFGVMGTVFAEQMNFNDTKVFGGPSQSMGTLSRGRTNNYYQYVSDVNWNGQSGWKTRGYSLASGQTCSNLISITGTGYYYVNYISLPSTVYVNNSISSSNVNDYLVFSGTISV